jgi:hypothetical protein
VFFLRLSVFLFASYEAEDWCFCRRERTEGTGRGMVKVKGVEWNHVVVVKEPEKHGMATLVRCAHCEKEFQGNAMRIRAHLLGNKRSAGVSGCPSCPEEAWEELRIIDEAKCLTKRKREARRGLRATSTPLENGALDNGLQMELMTSLQKGEKTAMEQAFRNMVFQAGGLPLNFVSVSPFKAVLFLHLTYLSLLSPPCVALRSPSLIVRNFLRNAGVLDHHNSAAKLLRVSGVFVVLHDLCNCEDLCEFLMHSLCVRALNRGVFGRVVWQQQQPQRILGHSLKALESERKQ